MLVGVHLRKEAAPCQMRLPHEATTTSATYINRFMLLHVSRPSANHYPSWYRYLIDFRVIEMALRRAYSILQSRGEYFEAVSQVDKSCREVP